MTRVVIAAIPLAGHVAPLRPIAADLGARGHDVVFVTGPSFEDQVAIDRVVRPGRAP